MLPDVIKIFNEFEDEIKDNFWDQVIGIFAMLSIHLLSIAVT